MHFHQHDSKCFNVDWILSNSCIYLQQEVKIFDTHFEDEATKEIEGQGICTLNFLPALYESYKLRHHVVIFTYCDLLQNIAGNVDYSTLKIYAKENKTIMRNRKRLLKESKDDYGGTCFMYGLLCSNSCSYLQGIWELMFGRTIFTSKRVIRSSIFTASNRVRFPIKVVTEQEIAQAKEDRDEFEAQNRMFHLEEKLLSQDEMSDKQWLRVDIMLLYWCRPFSLGFQDPLSYRDFLSMYEVIKAPKGESFPYDENADKKEIFDWCADLEKRDCDNGDENPSWVEFHWKETKGGEEQLFWSVGIDKVNSIISSIWPNTVVYSSTIFDAIIFKKRADGHFAYVSFPYVASNINTEPWFCQALLRHPKFSFRHPDELTGVGGTSYLTYKAFVLRDGNEYGGKVEQFVPDAKEGENRFIIGNTIFVPESGTMESLLKNWFDELINHVENSLPEDNYPYLLNLAKDELVKVKALLLESITGEWSTQAGTLRIDRIHLKLKSILLEANENIPNVIRFALRDYIRIFFPNIVSDLENEWILGSQRVIASKSNEILMQNISYEDTSNVVKALNMMYEEKDQHIDRPVVNESYFQDIFNHVTLNYQKWKERLNIPSLVKQIDMLPVKLGALMLYITNAISDLKKNSEELASKYSGKVNTLPWVTYYVKRKNGLDYIIDSVLKLNRVSLPNHKFGTFEYTLNDDQSVALRQLLSNMLGNTGTPNFLLGGAGTGKTFMIRVLSLCLLKITGVEMLWLALTAKAAKAIGGVTIHSLMQIEQNSTRSVLVTNSMNFLVIKGATFICIDEFSLLDSEVWGQVQAVLQQADMLVRRGSSPSNAWI